MPAAARLSRAALVLSCEHASNRVPAAYAARFRGGERLLASHRAYDAGALPVAQLCARKLRAPLFAGDVTRLVVDLNRPEGHPALFSHFIAGLDAADREKLLERFHRRHWTAVRSAVEARLGLGSPVLHLSLHSFTPVLRGERRRADVGFLFDPRRRLEKELCDAWRETLRRALRARGVELTLMHNSPYSGAGAGLTTSLRALLPEKRYAGIEIELNQRLWRRGGATWEALSAALLESLAGLVP
ncbi:MAG: N-formylglutamate amidohydrolase [Polyangiaceae bacterium]